MCCTLWLSTPVPPKGVLEYPLSTPTMWGRPTALPSMATDPPGRLMRKHGDEQRPVYFGKMDDQKDAEFVASDSESSDSSAASSVASSKEEHLREVEDAAAKVRKLAQFSDLTYVRCTLDVAGAPGSEHPARCFETRDRRSVLNIVRSREDERHGADTADHG